jgi:long-chain acyl-CoA synthetase
MPLLQKSDNLSKPWLKNYPKGVSHELGELKYNSLVEMFEESFQRFARRDALKYFGKYFTYGILDQLSQQFASYLQTLHLQQGTRIAIMMPNVPQFQISMLGILRAGYVVVNVNPLYTARELEFQLKDSGASVLIILENFAHVYQQISTQVPLKKVIVTSLGELIGAKGLLINFVVRKVKKVVPPWHLLGCVGYKEAIDIGSNSLFIKPTITPNDIAFLQYTGGTTGLSKGAVLLHRNILSNVLQMDFWLEPALKRQHTEQLVFLCALPLYHIFALTACAILGMRKGGLLILVPNPRDFDSFIKLILKHPEINIFPGVSTLFKALLNRPRFKKVQFRNLLLTIGGGMAVQKSVADQWQLLTGSPIVEGYGLSETSPVACANSPVIDQFTGHIGLPLPSTEIAILDDAGEVMPYGDLGEIAIRGPQLMAGYWNSPEETKQVMTTDGFFRTGDIGVMSSDGYVKIIDRKKDMINVSGFNVYPNEVEEILSLIPGVLECAVVGIADENTGEVVKAFIVRENEQLTKTQIHAFCQEQLTNYKRPKQIEFLPSLPKTNVGKILRRELKN